MALYTSSYLKQRSANKSYEAGLKLLNESKKYHTHFDIFLSHSYLDKDEVEGIYLELTDAGFNVYVDWITDPKLDRNRVTRESAALIRNRMKMSRSLLLAISTNAGLSKWIPWELGFVDGNVGQCAILPVSKNDIAPKIFDRSEYLLLYPYVKRAAIDWGEQLLITESSYRYVSLASWVRDKSQPTEKNKNIDLL